MKTELISINFQNFMSYGADGATVDLQNKEPVLITGTNHDASSEGQLDSNGAGKTTILNAISYLFYDKVINPNLDKNDLINRYNKKDMLVIGVVKTDECYYKIIRFRKHKALGGDGIKILKSDDGDFDAETVSDITPDSISAANHFISTKILNMPFDVFSRVAVYSSKHEPFLSLPTSHASKANQKDIIEEIFGLTELTNRSENLKKQAKETKDHFDRKSEINDIIVRNNNERANRINSINEKLFQWETDRQNTISSIENFINGYQSSLPDDLEYQEKLISSEKTLTNSLIECNRNINVITAKINSIQSEIQKDGERLEFVRFQVFNTKEKIYELSQIDFRKIEKSLKKIETLKSMKVDLQSNKVQLSKKSSDLSSKIFELEKEIKSLEHSTCPYCNQHYKEAEIKLQEKELIMVELANELSKTKLDIEEIESGILVIEEKLNNYNDSLEYDSLVALKRDEDELEHLKKLLSNLENEVISLQDQDKLRELTEVLNNSQQNLINITKERDEIQSKIESIRQQITISDIDSVKETMREIKNKTQKLQELKNSVNPYQSMLDLETNSEVQEDLTGELNELDKLITHQKFLLKVLTKKDSFARKAILKKSLPLLNERLKVYLEKIKLPHRVEFKEDMSAKIFMFDTELEYEQLSSGQQARINLALSFAFRDVLQFRTGRFSFCMLDECLDTGLSNVGVQNAVKMIKEIANEQNLNMMVISHRDEVQSMFKTNLHVELTNGFSKIKAA